MSFQLVPKSVILNDLEQRNGLIMATLRSRCRHYIFALWFLLSFFLLSFFLA